MLNIPNRLSLGNSIYSKLLMIKMREKIEMIKKIEKIKKIKMIKC